MTLCLVACAGSGPPPNAPAPAAAPAVASPPSTSDRVEPEAGEDGVSPVEELSPVVTPMEVDPDELLGFAPPRRPRPRAVIEGPELPRQLLTVSVRMDTVPLAGASSAATGEKVHFTEMQNGVAVVMSPGLVSEVELGDVRFFLDMRGNPLGSGVGALGHDVRFPCVDGVSRSVRWRGFRPVDVKTDSLVFSELFGTMDRSRCVAEAHTRLDVEATALLPRLLYAFRRCVSYCDPGVESQRREVLTVVAPPSSFVLASEARPDEMTRPHVGTFSVVEAPVEIDRAASASIRLPVEAFTRLHGLVERYSPAGSSPSERPSVVGASGLEVDVEVTGPSSGGDPASLTLHVSALVDPAPPAPAPGGLDPRRLRAVATP